MWWIIIVLAIVASGLWLTKSVCRIKQSDKNLIQMENKMDDGYDALYSDKVSKKGQPA